MAITQKKEDFFLSVGQLVALIENEKFMNVLCNVILLINLLRVIQCTSVHPRYRIRAFHAQADMKCMACKQLQTCCMRSSHACNAMNERDECRACMEAMNATHVKKRSITRMYERGESHACMKEVNHTHV